MGNDGGVVAGSSGQFATISQLLLQLAHDGSLGHGTNGHHVADGQTSLLAAVDKLSGVHTLDRDERLLALLESVVSWNLSLIISHVCRESLCTISPLTLN